MRCVCGHEALWHTLEGNTRHCLECGTCKDLKMCGHLKIKMQRTLFTGWEPVCQNCGQRLEPQE